MSLFVIASVCGDFVAACREECRAVTARVVKVMFPWGQHSISQTDASMHGIGFAHNYESIQKQIQKQTAFPRRRHPEAQTQKQAVFLCLTRR